jgi:hypothetical protein
MRARASLRATALPAAMRSEWAWRRATVDVTMDFFLSVLRERFGPGSTDPMSALTSSVMDDQPAPGRARKAGSRSVAGPS